MSSEQICAFLEPPGDFQSFRALDQFGNPLPCRADEDRCESQRCGRVSTEESTDRRRAPCNAVPPLRKLPLRRR
jgi:hypothetical protein